MMALRALAFDLEGTVVNVEDIHHASHLRAAADAGVKLSLRDVLRNLPHFVGGPDEMVAAEISRLPGSTLTPGGVLAAKRLHFAELIGTRRRIAPRPGFRAFLDWARTRGLKVAIGTVSNRSTALYLLERSRLTGEFPESLVVFREDIRKPKPAPDVYLETARRMGVGPDSQLVFEDSPIGVRAAHLAGSSVVAVTTLRSAELSRRLLDSGACVVCRSWTSPAIKVVIANAGMSPQNVGRKRHFSRSRARRS